MSIQYYVASSIDGFIADSDNRIDWLLQFGFDAFAEHYERFLADVGAIVMGSATYEFVVGEGAEAWGYGTTPTFVFTNRELPAVEGADIRVVRGVVDDVLPEILSAAGPRNVWLVGGGDLARQFAAASALDELWLTIMPIALGAGRPVLPVEKPSAVARLVATTPFDGGAVELRYRFDR